jgi:hypothetical protein
MRWPLRLSWLVTTGGMHPLVLSRREPQALRPPWRDSTMELRTGRRKARRPTTCLPLCRAPLTIVSNPRESDSCLSCAYEWRLSWRFAQPRPCCRFPLRGLKCPGALPPALRHRRTSATLDSFRATNDSSAEIAGPTPSSATARAIVAVSSGVRLRRPRPLRLR